MDICAAYVSGIKKWKNHEKRGKFRIIKAPAVFAAKYLEVNSDTCRPPQGRQNACEILS